MSNRLNQEREQKLQPIRIEKAKSKLNQLGLSIVAITDTRIDFIYKDERIQFYPYSGWHTGKTIKDGRGFDNLFYQLTKP